MFPQARDLQSYWANILNRVDAITDVPPTHWRLEDYFDKDPKSPDRTYAARGGFLAPVDFPPLEFGITPNALEAIDTTQLLGLMVARDALEDAGYGPGRDFDRGRVSVILGVTGTLELVIPLGARLGHPIWRKALKESGVEETVANEVVQRIANSYVGWQEDSFPGLLGNVVAGRIANRLDLGGTNCVVDAACASSLSALHLATLELAAGRCDMVLSGGLDTFNNIFMYMCFSKTPALSPTGNARPFDVKADGTILGEGLGVVVLKRLADAERDGDHIYAVIKGIGSSSDGKGNAIYAPNPAGQAKALRQAYRLSGVTPDTVELVEAHGTGTRAGDAAELTALTEVFQESQPEASGKPWCAVGSVKSQIGHTKAAAGAAGLIKAALALHHRVLPPTIKVDQPTEAATRGPFYINAEKRPWLPNRDHPRRAGVSSFGFGGSNFHCVLEEYRSVCQGPAELRRRPEVYWDGSVQILAFSAKTQERLADQLAHWPKDAAWDRLRHEASRLRAEFNIEHPYRLLAVVEKNKTNSACLIQNACTCLEKHAAKDHWSTPDGLFFGSGTVSGKLAFLFPGQGSQYVGMFQDLACQFPQIDEALAEANAAWRAAQDSSEQKNGTNGSMKTSEVSGTLGRFEQLSDFIYPPSEFSDETRARREEALRNTAVAQPAIGAVSLGALRILEHFGVRPQAVAGHSYGEFMALHAAGRIDAATLQSLSIFRGRLMAGAVHGADLGAMLAVRASLEVVLKILAEQSLDLTVANKNAPQQYVLSGSSTEINRAAEVLGRKNIDNKSLPVSAAFHSRFVAGVRQPLLLALEKTAWTRSRIPVFANTTGAEYPEDAGLARELLAGQLAQPVEFVAEIENMYQAGVRTFLEVGPGHTLTGLCGAILKDRDHQALAVDASSGKQSGAHDLARALAFLAAVGHRVDLSRWDGGGSKPPEAKPALTMSICGANYVKPKNEGAMERGLKMEDRKSAQENQRGDHQPSTRDAPSSVPESASLSAPPQPALAKQETQKPPTALEPSVVSTPRDVLWTQAFHTTQQNLLALQRQSEQTAQVHRQFLEGQDKALQVFQALLQQQQKVRLAAQGVPIADLEKVETAIPQRMKAPPSLISVPSLPETPLSSPRPLALETKAGPEIENAPPSASRHIDPSPFKHVLLEVVAEKTGYPAEMLDLEMELDSDLGIDSIKRVEIFSALQERLPQAPAVKSEHLGTLRTLDQVVEFLSNSADTGRLQTEATSTNGLSYAGLATGGSEQVHSVLLQVVSEKTGYPAEMLELDMELDSDLGIDSIKRVEIFSALQERMPEAPMVKSEHLGTLRTLRQVLEFLCGGRASTQPEPSEVRSPARKEEKAQTGAIANGSVPFTNGYHVAESAVEAVHRSLRRFVLTTQAVSPNSPRQPLALGKGGEFWITDEGGGLAGKLARLLEELGYSARLVNVQSWKSLPSPSRLAGLIILASGRGMSEGFLREAFGLLKIAAPGLRDAGKVSGAVFVTVSRMDGAFGLKDSCNPVSGGLAGITKTAAMEWSEVYCKALDLDVDWNDLDAAAHAIGEEVFLDGPEEVGLSQEGNVTLGLSEKELAVPASISPNSFSVIAPGEIVMVTGGARGVTAEAAVALARSAQPTLILLGRSPEPKSEPSWLTALTEESEIKKALLVHAGGHLSPRELEEQFRQTVSQREIRHTIQRIQEAGATVYYRSLDIRDESAVRAMVAGVRAQWGPIRGLVHGAGVLADRLIEDKTLEQFDQVYSTKVTGLRVLLDILDPKDLKVLALFSSSTARFGRAGQVDYAAANEVLNKLAQREARRRPRCRIVSINWGPWDGGMVTPALKKVFANEGIGLIPLQAGAEFLVHEINQTSDRPVEVVVMADPIHPTLSLGSTERMTVAFERTLDVEQYPFLASHVIDGKAVLPLAMIMEWLAHGALHGLPGMMFHGLDQVRVLRGVILEEDQSCTIRVLAGKSVSKGPFTHVPVELHSVGVAKGKSSGNIVHARGEVILTARLPEPDSRIPEIQVESYSRDLGEIYSQLLFHGPLLQGLERVEGCSNSGIIGIVIGAPAPSAWIQVPLRNTWLSDPLAMDAAFQLVVLWGYENFGCASLPCFVGRYRQYRRSLPRKGIRVVVQVKEAIAQRARADITFMDVEGNVVARLENYEAVLEAHLNQAFRRNRLGLEVI